MTLKGEREGMEDIAALFAQRGEAGADGAEGLGPGAVIVKLVVARMLSLRPPFES